MKKTFILCAAAFLTLSIAAFAQPSLPKAPEDPAFQHKELPCTNSSGKILYGELYTPVNGPSVKPLVIMAHGFNSTYTCFYDIIPELAKDGFLCYAFD